MQRSSPAHDQVSQQPMRGRYFVRNRVANAMFRAMDAALAAFARLFPAYQERSVRRLLIANGSHLGDVVLSTSVLPVIRAAIPDIQIGMLVGSWGAPVVRDHPLLDWVHIVDHWKLNRAPMSIREKFVRYWRSRRQALREIREVGYDCAIDLYFWFPNTILLLRAAGIPQRVGYTSAGFGPLLTQPLELVHRERSIIEYHLDLLRQVPDLAHIRPELAYPSLPRAAVGVEALMGAGPYLIVHMGSGSPRKDWPLPSWRELVRLLSAAGCRLVFTGAGEREQAQVAAVINEAAQAVDLCNRLKWHEFVEVVAGGSLLVGVDSVAGHIAAAVRTPVVVIGHGMNNPALWHPVSPSSQVVTKPMLCAPCYRKNGCAAMSCIRELAPAVVAERVAQVLGRVPAEAVV